jgi:hypothetical protein
VRLTGEGKPQGRSNPVHAIQALIASACDPALHGGQGHAKAVRDLAQGSAGPDRFDHLTPSLAEVDFCSWQAPQDKVSCHAKRVALTSEKRRLTPGLATVPIKGNQSDERRAGIQQGDDCGWDFPLSLAFGG